MILANCLHPIATVIINLVYGILSGELEGHGKHAGGDAIGRCCLGENASGFRGGMNWEKGTRLERLAKHLAF